ETIGSIEDLGAATLEDVQNFHRTYYRPDNATLTVTGGFVPAEAKALIQSYFGGIPRGTATIPRNSCTQPFKLPVRREFTDASAQLPAVMATFGLPAAGEKDMAALTVLNAILTDGESSRLNDRLGKRERAAVQLVPLFLERRGPGLAMYFMVANQGVGPEKLEALFDEELARVRDGGVTEAEIARARNRLRAGEVLQRQSPHGLAEALQTGVHFHGDPNWVNRSLEPYAAVTAADVQRVARQYFTNDNRALAVITPAAAAKD
ncbi:MAG: insulinase family protein, partial [Gemmatimonadetes bacterium]|nr:insulinase family protein [Gemmatimonadota bacterium]